MALYRHTPHPHVAARTGQGPITVSVGRLTLNDRIAARCTVIFGTMGMTYAFVVYGALGALFTAQQATLLYWSNWIQLWSLPLLMVGSLVLGRAADRRNQQAFNDTEALLHGQEQLAAHQGAQDELLLRIATHLGLDPVRAPGGNPTPAGGDSG